MSCPQDRLANAFHLPSQKKAFSGPQHTWQDCTRPIRLAGFEGDYTNHSLRVFLTTRLYDAKVNEQDRTNGVQAYKRTLDKLKQLTLDVLTIAPNLPEEHTELIMCNKHVCLETTKNNLFFQISEGSHITININIIALAVHDTHDATKLLIGDLQTGHLYVSDLV